jgi:hypothetical protein
VVFPAYTYCFSILVCSIQIVNVSLAPFFAPHKSLWITHNAVICMQRMVWLIHNDQDVLVLISLCSVFLFIIMYISIRVIYRWLIVHCFVFKEYKNSVYSKRKYRQPFMNDHGIYIYMSNHAIFLCVDIEVFYTVEHILVHWQQAALIFSKYIFIPEHTWA